MTAASKKTERKPGLSLSNTRLDFWAERDRVNLCLVDIHAPDNEAILLDMWDEGASEYLDQADLRSGGCSARNAGRFNTNRVGPVSSRS